MKKYFILFAVLITNWPLFSQQPGRPAEETATALSSGEIKGVIQDSTTSGAIEYATVGIFRKDSSLVNGQVTDSDGKFVFNNIPAGEYYIDANFLGYSKKHIQVTVNSQRTGINLGVVVLHPNVTEIDEVEVVAQRNRVEYKIDKKVVNVASDLNSAGGTLVNVLENTPSVEVDVEGNVSLRGSGNFQLLIDGKPSPIQGSEGLQQIPASAVQSLEIITSPSAKYDPDGNAGIINVIMKKQKNSGVGGIINASIGTRDKYTADFLLNIKRNRFNYFLGGEYSNMKFHNEGVAERRTFLGGTTTTINSDINGVFGREGMNLKGGFDYSINDNSVISLNGTVGKRDFTRDFVTQNKWFTLPASKDSFYLEDGHDTDDDKFYNLNLDFQKRYDHPDHQLQASAYFSSQKEVEKEQDNVRKTNDAFEPIASNALQTRSRTEQPERELRLELDYTRPVGSGKFETGLQSRWDQTEADYIFEDFQPLGNEWFRNDTISNSLYYLDALQSAYAIYSGPLGKFEYQAGLRAEYDNRKLEQRTTNETFVYENLHLFPSVYVTRKFNDAHQLQFTYTRRIQRPRTRELNPFKEFRGTNNVFFGNPSLRPEFTNAFELNYQYKFDKGFVSLETYYRATYDKITQINGVDTLSGRPVFTFTTTNADKDNALGIELMTNLDLTKWWQLNITGNVFRYELNGEVEGNNVTSISTSWRTNLNSMFKMKWDTRLQITAIYNGPSNTLQGRREGFFITNVAVRKEMLKRKLTVSLNARDILATGKFAFESEGSTFYAFNRFKREAPVVTLNLSYRLNNYRQNANRRGEEGGEGGGGMDDMM
jgi:outer membrane receptor protein involved in Fe transport